MIDALQIDRSNLINCNQVITAVGGSKLNCYGWLPIQFSINENFTTQPVYICDKVDKIYFSRRGCLETQILPPTFPFPMNSTVSAVSKSTVQPSQPSKRKNPPFAPKTLPYTPSPENIPKLKQFILDQFADTAFNTGERFPTMHVPPAQIHLKPDAVPYATHIPIPVPHHWKDEVKKVLMLMLKKR